MTTQIEVELISTETAIITLRGEHDLGTRAPVVAAFERAGSRRHLVIDLSRCTFADSSVLSAITRAAGTADAWGGHAVLVLAPAGSPVRRSIEVMGIDALVAVHASRIAALAAVGHAHRDGGCSGQETGSELRRSA